MEIMQVGCYHEATARDVMLRTGVFDLWAGHRYGRIHSVIVEWDINVEKHEVEEQLREIASQYGIFQLWTTIMICLSKFIGNQVCT